MIYLSILSTLVTFIFAMAVLARWRYKKPRHLLFWGVGLIFYGLGTMSEAILAFGFHAWVLKLWYLMGAMLTAAWLGQGSIYLLARKRGVADSLFIALGVISLAALIFVIIAPVSPDAAALYNIRQPASAQYKDLMGRNGGMILLTILLNIYGTVALVGGAIYSAFLFWRKRVLANRMLGNVLIATGALMPAMAGSLLKAGLVDVLYISEFVGVVLMYGGFLLATATKPAEIIAQAATD